MQENYDYYHYLSGVDLPIKKKTDILRYFSDNPGKQYIHFERKTVQDKYVDRLRTHSFFQDNSSNNLQLIDKVIRRMERMLHFDRTRKSSATEFQYGINRFSITHDFAKYVIEKKEWIKMTFRNTRCGDELFIQTLVVNSPYRDQLTEIAFEDNYMACLRFIDWKRGKPYIFRLDNYDELIESPYLFDRKFDEKVDIEIINAIFQYCLS